MEYKNILKELSMQNAVTGYEKAMSTFVANLFKKHCDNVEVDRFFNVIGIIKGRGKSKRKVMVTAHYDEIGLIVKSIDENGFIRVANLGGIDSKILLAQEVIVHGKKDIFGIIGAKPPHLLKPEEAKSAVKLENLYIDAGMGVDKLKEIVTIGDSISLKTSAFELQGNKISSKAMDNRSSIVALLKMMKELTGMKHEADIYFIATTQEEITTLGAITASYNLEPDFAIVVDTCHGEMPDASKDDAYVLGKGPAIGVGPNLHKKLTKKIIEIAKDEDISFQIDIEPGDSGTEAWVTQVSRAGIPTILLSIPIRYMHTTIETVNMDDIKNTGKLGAFFIVKSESEMEDVLCF